LKIIHIETVLAKPHLETSGEIALRSVKNKDNTVKFVYLGKNLLWHDWEIPSVLRFFRFSKKKRLIDFMSILNKNKIEILNEDNYDNFQKKSILDWSKNFKGSINDLYKKKYKNITLGKGVLSSLVSFYRDLNFDTRKHKREIEKMLFNAAVILRRTEMLIKLEKPNQIVTFNGRFSVTYPIVALSNKLKISVLQHDRGSGFDKFEIYENNIHEKKSRYLAIKKHWKVSQGYKKKIGHLYYIERRQKKKMGSDFGLHFTSGQRNNYLKFKKKNKILIVYFSSTDYEVAAIFNDNNQENKFNFFYETISKLNYVDLIIRVHPDVKKKNFREDDKWRKYNSTFCTVLESDDKTDSYKLLETADIVVGYGSSILIEALYWKKNVYTLNCNDIYYYSGAIKLIDNKKNILDIFSKSYKFSNSHLNKCLLFGYYYKTFGKKFKYYNPYDFFNGKFMNQSLEWKSKIILFLEKVGLKLLYFYFKDRRFRRPYNFSIINYNNEF
jgi:hypothetical protein